MSIKAELPSKVIVAVLSTLIVGVIYMVLDWIKPSAIGMVSWIWSGIVACFMWFFDRVYMPRWLFLLIAGLSAAFAYQKAHPYVSAKRKPRQPTFKLFREFHHFGMVWRWSWHGDLPVEILSYCSQCDRIMRYMEDRAYVTSPNPTVFYCQNCTNVRIPRNEPHEETMNKIAFEIEHRVRTGSWKRHVENSPA